jgi:hypothetical protein
MQRIEVEQRTIFIGLAGSHGYGLNRPDSDYDYRGVFIAPKKYYLGFDRIEQKDAGWDVEPGIYPFLNGNKDTVIYELRKIIQLLSGANPNVLELLWLNDYPVLNSVGQHLINHRQIFLSKKVKHTYSGYAFAQIKKMETHRKWLLNPPQNKPLPSDYGIEDEPLIKDELNAFLEYLYLLIRGRIEFLEESEKLYELLTADIDFKGVLKQYTLPDNTLEYTQKLTNSRKDFIRLLQKSQAYQVALREWKAYLAWQENRNPARAEMEKKSGYDLKHGMHCIRLLRSGLEILKTGDITVDRRISGDAEDLRAILKGEYSYDELTKMADDLVAQMDIIYHESTLPHSPNLEQINDLCMELVEMQGWNKVV